MIDPVTRVMCPGHITGFFEICRSEDARYTGSRGAGVCISKGVKTSVFVKESIQPEIEIKINGESQSAPVTRSVVDQFLKFVQNTLSINVIHEIEVPMGSGFGASGAGALSTAMALNQELDLNMTRNGVATIAHIAEVENATGLGDVIAQTYGGAEIRLEPGAPGIGKVDQFILDPMLQIICMSLGPLETKTIITDPLHEASINQAGNKLISKLLKKASIENFLVLSRKFMEESQLASEKLKELLNYVTDLLPLPASMVMLGESLFTFVEKTKSIEICDEIEAYSPKLNVFICDVDYRGPRIIEA